MQKKYATYISILILLAGWQLIAVIVDQPVFFPTLPELIKSFGELFLSETFYLSILATLLRGITGMLLSFLLALGLSGLFVRYPVVYDLFRPLLIIMRSVPVVSFILIALIFLHPESIPLLIGFLTMFPLLTENLTNGLGSLRPELSVMAHQFRLGKYNRWTQILYPQVKPFLFSGLASAMGFGWRAIIMGEVLSQCRFGIGSEMKQAQTFIAVPDLLVWTFVAVIISFLTDRGIRRFSTSNLPIHYSKKENGTASIIFPKGLSVELSDVSYTYAVSHFTYSFRERKIYGISAPSGKGKTTLISLINGTLQPISGSVAIDRRYGIASLFQEPELLQHLNVLENVALPLAGIYFKEKAFLMAQEMLEVVEMGSYTAQYPEALSYGQQQRVAIARALVFPSPYLFLDEPFKGLDTALTHRIIQTVKKMQTERQQTLLFTSHQQDELDLLADEVVFL